MAVKDVVGALDEIRAVLEENGSELPAVDTDDNGKVLTVVEGAWGKATIPSQLPSVSGSDVGKVLMVDESGKWVAADLPTGD